jgi:hypothetical protein
MLAGQVIVGGVVSTVKVVVQVLLLPISSVTVTVIVCVPGPTTVPAGGLCVMVRSETALQLSEAMTLGITFGMAAWQLAGAVVPGGHVTVGGVVSMIFTTSFVMNASSASN